MVNKYRVVVDGRTVSLFASVEAAVAAADALAAQEVSTRVDVLARGAYRACYSVRVKAVA